MKQYTSVRVTKETRRRIDQFFKLYALKTIDEMINELIDYHLEKE